jgi:hypothetical protein
MKRNQLVPVIIFVALGIILLVYFLLTGDDEKRYSWYENYKSDNIQPYGTAFVKQMLESYRPGAKLIVNTKKSLKDLLADPSVVAKTDYVFIGQSIHLTSDEADALANYIALGNDAFIASLEVPQYLIEQIHSYECERPVSFLNNLADSAIMNFYHDTLANNKGYMFKYRFRGEDVPYYWSSVAHEIFCDSTTSVLPLGYQAPDLVNFIKITHGKGNLYLHSNPIVFSNYFIAKRENLEYASGVFSHLSGHDIYWDEYSKVPYSGNNNSYNSPLYYILQQPALKYAWWFLMITILLYILFAAKRTQRVIPVLETKTNTSLEFVHLISALHYQNANHLDMAKKKMKFFLYFIRSKYGIQTQTFKEEQIIHLAEKSKVPEAEIRSIFTQFSLIERNAFGNMEANRLLDFYSSIENFYKHCK